MIGFRMEYEIFKDDLVNGGIRYNIISNSMYIYIYFDELLRRNE
jgi:hypothetical protein